MAHKLPLWIEPIDERATESNGDVMYVGHVRYRQGTGSMSPTHTLRVRIRWNSHEFQSWGKIERWDGTEWREVATRIGDDLECHHPVKMAKYSRSRHAPDDPELFWPDVDALIEQAKAIIG